jgi:hypothetical protein
MSYEDDVDGMEDEDDDGHVFVVVQLGSGSGLLMNNGFSQRL